MFCTLKLTGSDSAPLTSTWSRLKLSPPLGDVTVMEGAAAVVELEGVDVAGTTGIPEQDAPVRVLNMIPGPQIEGAGGGIIWELPEQEAPVTVLNKAPGTQPTGSRGIVAVVVVVIVVGAVEHGAPVAVLKTTPGPQTRGVDAGIIGTEPCDAIYARVSGPKYPDAGKISTLACHDASAVFVRGPKRPVGVTERNPSVFNIC